jgi:hypothetical protein
LGCVNETEVKEFKIEVENEPCKTIISGGDREVEVRQDQEKKNKYFITIA